MQVDRRLWFASYVQTYLERDVRDLLQVGDLGTFSRFLSLAAARSGLLLNLADLARDVGVSAPTVRRWISVLEASHVAHLLRPHHRSFGKRLVKSPRLVFADVGLVTFLLALHDPAAALSSPSAGALVETAVIGEWIKLFRQSGEEPALHFWRSAGGLEVDLVIERNGRLTPSRSRRLPRRPRTTPTPWCAGWSWPGSTPAPWSPVPSTGPSPSAPASAPFPGISHGDNGGSEPEPSKRCGSSGRGGDIGDGNGAGVGTGCGESSRGSTGGDGARAGLDETRAAPLGGLAARRVTAPLLHS